MLTTTLLFIYLIFLASPMEQTKPGLTNSIALASQNGVLQETDNKRKLLRPRLIVSRKTDSTGHHGKRILPMKPHAHGRTEEGK